MGEILNGPYYEVPSSELAAWLEQQGKDRWWNVDGDPLLTGEMPFPCILFLTSFDEPLDAVPPQSFEQPISQRVVVELFDGHQRLVHELLDMIERIALRPDRFDSCQIKTAGENRQSSEQSAFLLTKQVVAPVDRRSQRLMASSSSGQKPKSIR